VLRLNLPAEVDSSNSTAARSKTTGHLVLTMPKIHPEENSLGLRVAARDKIKVEEESLKVKQTKEKERELNKLSGMMQAEALKARASSSSSSSLKPTGGAVQLKGLVPVRKGGIATIDSSAQMKEVSSSLKKGFSDLDVVHNSDLLPPPPACDEASGEAVAVDGGSDVDVLVDEDEPPPIF
jgi:hypothetical protein